MEQIEKGPRIGVPAGPKLIRPNKAIEDPLTDEEQAKFEQAGGPAPAPFPAGPAPQALIVEDDPPLRELLVTILKAWDLEITAVGTGTDAIKALCAKRVDFIVVDLRLPGHDGYEVIRCARSYVKLRQTEIVVLSGASEPKDVLAALNVGADVYLRKPISLDLLQASLKPLVRRLYDRLGG